LNSAPQLPEKKPYQKPSLKIYGDIHALTGTSNTKGKHFDFNFKTFGFKTH